MSLRQLQTLVAIADRGSFQAAAESLGLTQSAVSMQIKALEDELRTTLFERRGPSIQLTPEGSKFLDMAQPLVESIDSLNERFRKEVRGSLETGEVVIAAGESTIIYILPELVGRFRERYPDIHVQLRNVTGRDGLAMIRDDEVDFAVGSMLDIPGDIGYTPLYAFDPALILPLEHPLSQQKEIGLEDISPYGLILPPRRLTTWRLVDRVFQQARVPYEVVLEVGGWEVIKRYVELGFGISIVTSICLREEDRLVSRNMGAYFPRRTYGIVTRKGRHLPPPARAFLNEIGETPISQSQRHPTHSAR